jgi:hypothetical protein
LWVIARRIDSGRANHSDDSEDERPDAEPHDGAMAAIACGNSGFVEAVEADRHPWAALVGTVDSLMTSRHSTLGTT